MATHAVRGIVSFPFEVDVDIESADGFTVEDLFAFVDADSHGHFGLLAFDDLTDIFVSDHDATVTISSVDEGSVIVDDDLPLFGIADGKGGVVWQEV